MNDTKGITARVISRAGGEIMFECSPGNDCWHPFEYPRDEYHQSQLDALLQTQASQLAEDQRERLVKVRGFLNGIRLAVARTERPVGNAWLLNEIDGALASLDDVGGAEV